MPETAADLKNAAESGLEKILIDGKAFVRKGKDWLEEKGPLDEWLREKKDIDIVVYHLETIKDIGPRYIWANRREKVPQPEGIYYEFSKDSFWWTLNNSMNNVRNAMKDSLQDGKQYFRSKQTLQKLVDEFDKAYIGTEVLKYMYESKNIGPFERAIEPVLTQARRIQKFYAKKEAKLREPYTEKRNEFARQAVVSVGTTAGIAFVLAGAAAKFGLGKLAAKIVSYGRKATTGV